MKTKKLKVITVKRATGKPSKYHKSRLKLNKDGSITVFE